MAQKLQFVVAMRLSILTLIFVLFLPGIILASAPQLLSVNPRGTVESAEISGIDQDQISGDVRDAIHNLSGKPFDQNAADALVVRIQAEQPNVTVTVRLAKGSQSNLVKVFFVVEKNDSQLDHDQNVNSRYTVERVDVEGSGESRVSKTIRDEMQQLVGEKLNQEKANQILSDLNRELRPTYSAVKKVMKGSDPQHVVVIYEIHKARLIPFVEMPSQRIVYNSKQNFSVDITVPIDLGRHNRIFGGGSDDQDELIERFAGFNFGFESTRVGTDHLGLALRYGRYHERWQPATVSADPNSIYRERNTFEPSVTIGFDPRLRLNAGVSVSDLQIQYPAIHTANANAAVASLTFHNIWGDAVEAQHNLDAVYDLRAGNHALDSDFIYTRQLISAQYLYQHHKDKLSLSFLAGRISGNAPLFDRFSLGNTSTLRGWNKFDIAPAGGDRMIYGSVQYGFGKPQIGDFDLNLNKRKAIGQIPLGLHVFYDVGAVGNAGSPMVARHSAGFGFGGSSFFIELGFPIRSSRVEPIFSTGFRF